MKNINKLKKGKKVHSSVGRKEIELECFKRISVQDVPLNEGVDIDKLKKTLTKPESTERDRVIARILLNPNVQKTISELKENYGVEFVEAFLKDNMRNIRKNSVQKLNRRSMPSKSDLSESEDPSDDEDVKPVSKSKKRKLQASRKEVKEVEMSVDSFFMKPSGENYLASVETSAPISSEDEDVDSAHRKEQSMGKNILKRERTAKNAKPKEIIAKSLTNEAAKDYRSRSKPEEQTSKVNHPPVKITEEPDIHPSWKAKSQMRKTQIQAFQGTKIKFDD